MMQIDELLDRVTPTVSETPTANALRAHIDRSERRRRAASVAMVAVMAVAVASAGWLLGTSDGDQAIETSVPTTALAPTTAPIADSPTTVAESASLATDRWFLVPPDTIDLATVSDQHLVWSNAQGEDWGPTTAVMKQPVANGAVTVYFLDYVGVEITDGPEEFTEVFREVDVDGDAVRIGSDPERGSVKVFRQWGDGVVCVVGWGLSEEEAFAVATDARVVDGEIVMSGELPQGLSHATFPAARPTDHRTVLGWSLDASTEVRLTMAPGPLVAGALETLGSDRQHVEVRSTEGVYVAATPDREPATMVWAEDGYWFSLAMERVGADVELGDLTSVAESLERIVQPDLVKRLGDPFMFDQAGTVERWLDNNALAPGWDPQPLIDAVPGGEFTVAFFTRQFVACTWGAEWLDAARAGDDARRQRAIDALSSGARWSVVQAEARAYEAIGGGAADERLEWLRQEFQATVDRMAGATTPAEIEAIGGEVSCAFQHPKG